MPDRRVTPTRRDIPGEYGEATAWGVAAVLLIAFAFFALATMPASCDRKEETARQYPTMDSLTYTYVNDSTQPPITVYVVTDSDTGQQYLVTDRGGITPRLEADDG